MGYKRPQESASKCMIQFDFLAFYRYCFEIEKKVNLRHSSFAFELHQGEHELGNASKNILSI